MGTKRESVEGKIAVFFQTADVLEAVLMFKVIKSILLSRGFELDGRKTAQKKSKAAPAGKRATLTPAATEREIVGDTSVFSKAS